MTSEQLAKELNKRYHAVGELKHLTLATPEQLDELKPQAGEVCHDLVDRWILLHPEHQAVRGFLAINDCFFNKHSVVNAGSMLLCVTPRNNSDSLTLLDFIVFDGGSRAAFDAWPAQVP